MGGRTRRLLTLAAVAGLFASACGARVDPPAAAPTASDAPARMMEAAGRVEPTPLPEPETDRLEHVRATAGDRPDVPEPGQSGWTPFATVGGITLVHPAATIARIGFHQSNHDGARQLGVLDGAANPVTLESRGRGTGSRTAADVVAAPNGEIRAPVTGTVVRAGTYVLYCEHADDYVVIQPDQQPSWEVKLLHISGVRVHAGDRVEAGVTVLAPRPTPLPFRSQVDDHTDEPSWPHVHIEVVDPSIPDRPSPGSGC